MELSKLQIGTVVTLTALISGLFSGYITNIDLEKTFYCEEKDMVLYCDYLSSTAKTCYFSTEEGIKGKRCNEGWVQISSDIIPIDIEEIDWETEVKIFGNRYWHYCPIVDGAINPYTTCISKEGSFAYLFELMN